MTEVGPNTKITISLQTAISVISTVIVGAGIYYNMATETYVDQKISKLEDKIAKLTDQSIENSTDLKLLKQSSQNIETTMKDTMKSLSESINTFETLGNSWNNHFSNSSSGRPTNFSFSNPRNNSHAHPHPPNSSEQE